MTNLRNELADALRQRIAIIGDEDSRRDAEKHLQRLQDISERIVALTAQLSAGEDPQLRHFLQRCSYSKALDYLEKGR